MSNPLVIGPFTQLLTMSAMPPKGPIPDDKIEIIKNGGVLIENGVIQSVGDFDELRTKKTQIFEIASDMVGLPGFIDPHTHICFAGSRSNDYAMRISGKTYLEIAKEGGGIWQTVTNTRDASLEDLVGLTSLRAQKHLKAGVTTAEVKSGYGLNLENELKMLETIDAVNNNSAIDLVPTCLATHIVPKDFAGNSMQYLDHILAEILPVIKEKKLTNRIDIFIDDGAFGVEESRDFLLNAKKQAFDITVHGDQFHLGGSKVAVETGAVSVDHLESSTDHEIRMLAKSETVSVVLPGASLGLGMSFAPARKLLDAGNCLAIGSDWNPGSAPMGNLLLQAAVLSAAEKLSNAETLAGITTRAAKALNLTDRGQLNAGLLADIIGFPCADYREILYHQGQMMPELVIKKGVVIK
jgi:imidazolonepropionase